MDTLVTHQSKPQWRYERPHRVRLHSYRIHVKDIYNYGYSDKEVYHKAAEEFSKTVKYAWVENNQVKLDFDFDNNSIDYFKQVRFYADLDETQYMDYCLRFFDHWNEEWK